MPKLTAKQQEVVNMQEVEKRCGKHGCDKPAVVDGYVGALHCWSCAEHANELDGVLGEPLIAEKQKAVSLAIAMNPQPEPGYGWDDPPELQDGRNPFLFIHTEETCGRDGHVHVSPVEKGDHLIVTDIEPCFVDGAWCWRISAALAAFNEKEGE